MSDKKIVACGLDLDDISSLAETVKKISGQNKNKKW